MDECVKVHSDRVNRDLLIFVSKVFPFVRCCSLPVLPHLILVVISKIGVVSILDSFVLLIRKINEIILLNCSWLLRVTVISITCCFWANNAIPSLSWLPCFTVFLIFCRRLWFRSLPISFKLSLSSTLFRVILSIFHNLSTIS